MILTPLLGRSFLHSNLTRIDLHAFKGLLTPGPYDLTSLLGCCSFTPLLLPSCSFFSIHKQMANGFTMCSGLRTKTTNGNDGNSFSLSPSLSFFLPFSTTSDVEVKVDVDARIIRTRLNERTRLNAASSKDHKDDTRHALVRL